MKQSLLFIVIITILVFEIAITGVSGCSLTAVDREINKDLAETDQSRPKAGFRQKQDGSKSTSIPATFDSYENADFFQVVRVVDGDTLKIDISGKVETVRLIGIDTPESVDPRRPVECFGKEAAKKTEELTSGELVHLEKDPSQGDRDKYGRLLRYAYLVDGTLINLLLIEEGYAHEFTYQIPYRFQEDFKRAEKKARELGKGLWADDKCNQ